MMTMNRFENPRMYAIDAYRDNENKISISVERMPELDCLIPAELCEENFNKEMFAIIRKIHCNGRAGISNGIVYFLCLNDNAHISHARYYFIVDDNYGYTHAIDRLRKAIGAYAMRKFDICSGTDAIEEMMHMYRTLVDELYVSKESAKRDAEEPGLKIYAYFNNFEDQPTRNLPLGLIRLRQIESILDGVQTEEQRLEAVAKANQIVCDYYSRQGMSTWVSGPDERCRNIDYLRGTVNYDYDIVCCCFVAENIESEVKRIEDEIRGTADLTPEQLLDNISEDPDFLNSDLGIEDGNRLWGMTRLAQMWSSLKSLL